MMEFTPPLSSTDAEAKIVKTREEWYSTFESLFISSGCNLSSFLEVCETDQDFLEMKSRTWRLNELLGLDVNVFKKEENLWKLSAKDLYERGRYMAQKEFACWLPKLGKFPIPLEQQTAQRWFAFREGHEVRINEIASRELAKQWREAGEDLGLVRLAQKQKPRQKQPSIDAAQSFMDGFLSSSLLEEEYQY